ncbi:hypothetical protein IGI04_003651 [Brassica rapa subsp. trilocularis]|uniref:F-box domain-containing protein n=1 Tax=Brassica rapa subsp. trilocularis TaxID=1813537 RepID=A0ABQ7P2J8_BRACM|nr:hypothetical protein IGI04_003651 [Brassica rapa subsp. trilocularis]
MTTMSDLPLDLTKEIFSRVPLTSLSSVRSTCKSWNSISKSQVLCESAAGRKQFLGFMMKDFSVCSMKFDLQGIQNKADFVNPSIKQSRLLVWNPYLGQTRWIQPRNTFLSGDQYALGYDKNRKHKILRILGDYKSGYMVLGYEIFDLSANTWKVSNDNQDWRIDHYQRDKLVLSCVREEQLAVLHYSWVMGQALEIWVTKKIDPEKKVVVVVYEIRILTGRNQSAHILGPDGYFKSVNIGETRYIGRRIKHGYMISELCGPLVCSSYVPSSVQLQTNQPVKSEEAARRKQFLGFMMKNFKVCSLKFDLQGIRRKKTSLIAMRHQRQVKVLGVESLFGANEVAPTKKQFHMLENYAIGYDKNSNYKLRIFGEYLKFGKPLPLPFKSHGLYKKISISCVREKQLAIDPCEISWSKFLRITYGCMDGNQAGSFFIDEEKKIFVVVDIESYKEGIVRNQKTNIIGQDGYFISVNMGKAHEYLENFGFMTDRPVLPPTCVLFLCSKLSATANHANQPTGKIYSYTSWKLVSHPKSNKP